MAAVTIKPAAILVPAAGGMSMHLLTNTNAEMRYTFKIKTSHNGHYRVNPVHGIVEPGAQATVDIIRLKGPPTTADDRLEVLFLPVDAECTDPKAPFARGQAPEFKLDVPMTAV